MMTVLLFAGLALWGLAVVWAIIGSVEEERRERAQRDVEERYPDIYRTSQGRRFDTPPRSPAGKKRGW